jgi:hypothetical protein
MLKLALFSAQMSALILPCVNGPYTLMVILSMKDLDFKHTT